MKSKKKTLKYKEGGFIEENAAGVGSAANMAGDLLQSTDSGFGDYAGAALKGAGALSMFGPIGMGIGAIGGLAMAGIKNHQEEKARQDALAKVPANYTANPYGIPTAQNGMMVNSPLINIEKGEIAVDPNTGEILEDYDSNVYKPHSKEGQAEWKHNFVQANGAVIIPKKYRDTYLKNKAQRMGIIRDVVNKQIDREFYGKDADGNHQKFTELGEDGVQQYLYGGKVPSYPNGGVTPDWEDPITGTVSKAPANTPMRYAESDALLAQLEKDFWNETLSPEDDPLTSSRVEALTNTGELVPMTGRTSPFSTPTTPSAAKPILPTTSDATLMKSRLDSPFTTNYTSPQAAEKIDLSKMGKAGKVTIPRYEADPSLWTTGNTVGMSALGLGALGPLATTLINGIDRDEVNSFLGVANKAINTLGDVYARGKAQATDALTRTSNAALEMNRNRTSNFASKLANAQNILFGTQRNLGSVLNQYDMAEARGKSQLELQGGIYEGQGRAQMLQNLDQNRDAFYSNLSANLSNAATMGMQGARVLNQHQENTTRYNTLPQFNFKVNPDGTYSFLPGTVTPYDNIFTTPSKKKDGES